MLRGIGGRLLRVCASSIAAVALLVAMPATGSAQTGAAASWGENWHGQLGTVYRSRQKKPPSASKA